MLTSNIIIKSSPLEDNPLKGTIFDSQKPSAFVPAEVFKIVKPKRVRQKAPKDDRWGKGLWTSVQQKAYINFLRERKQEMDVSTLRRSQKIFILMSKEVKTRSADQCRSHHQKIIKYHHTVEEAIEFFSSKLTPVHEAVNAGPNQSRDKTQTETVSIKVEESMIKIVMNCDMVAQF